MVILVVTGLLTVLFGSIFLKYPPKRINWFYGYRTSSSMKSQERWDFAQRHSARGMLRVGFYMLIAGLLGGWLPFRPVVQAFLAIPVMLLFFAGLIYATEKALKENFGK